MPTIDIIENPRRRRRRALTAKQLAAGFGGKGHMRRRSGGRRKRRNPGLMELAAINPRRRRHRSYAVSHRRRRRYSNPGVGSFFGGIDLTFAASAAGGIVLGKAAPGLIAKVWPGVPQDGLAGTAVRVAAVLAVSIAIRKFLKMPKVANGLITGEIAYEIFTLANQYLLPKIGLAGIGDDNDYLTMSDIDQLNLSGYVTQADRLSGYEVATSQMAA